jgi:hypothetical protein
METPRSVVARGGRGTPVPAIQPSSSVHTSSAAKRLPDGQLLSNQSYNSIVSSGNSRLLAGNVYNNHYHLAAPTTTQVETTSDEQKRLVRTLLRCLHFKEAGSRHAGIATAHPDTCRWVVDCPQYKRWRDPNATAEHHGCLWIKGKPGAGKSTIMKGLLRHAKEAYPNDKVVSFFFNARGTPLERSTEGMYRSILHQMASNVPSLFIDLDPETMEFYAAQGWPLELLKDLCRETIRHSTGKTGVTIFIDALDEGHVEDDVRDMVAFIEELTAGNSANNKNLHVCLASRHYPAISMRNVERLILDKLEDHDKDIATYVQTQLRIENAVMHAQLASTICKRASGVFLWVVLVVKILNKEADRGNQHKIQAKLQELPTSLHNLFDTIVERGSDNNACLLPTLIWVLFSRGSLQPIELYFAIVISTGQLSHGNMVWNPKLVDSTVVEKFLVSSSRGLVECVQKGYTRLKSFQVQITHESVREYLFADGLRKLDEDLMVDFEAKCHWRLAKWCMTYIKLAVEHGLLSGSQQAQSYRQCPLLEYAMEYALSHAETAARLGYRQIVHDTAPVETWRHFRNPKDYSTMLHLLLLERRHRLVAIELERVLKWPANDRQAYLNAQWLGTCTTLESAILMGNFGMAHVLLENGADANITCNRHGAPLKAALLECGIIERSFTGEEHFVDRSFASGIRSQIVGLLLENGADVSQPILGQTFWTIARRYRWFEVLELLVELGMYPVDTDPGFVSQWVGAVRDKDWGRIRTLLSTTSAYRHIRRGL